MNPTNYLPVFSILLAPVVLTSCNQKSQETSPNIVLIVADDFMTLAEALKQFGYVTGTFGIFRTRPGTILRWGDWKLHHYFEDDE